MEKQILSAENSDREYQILKENMAKNKQNQVKTTFRINKKGLLMHKNRMYIPNTIEIKLTDMNELHKQPYPGHPGYQKMITMLRKDFFCPNIKKQVA